MDPRWQQPFTCIVAGPTGCGKTTFVARLLRNASAMIDPPPERVTWYYGEWQTAYENLDIPNMRLEEGLPTSFDNGKRGLVVLDDLMAETDSRVTNLFTKKSHHSDTSVIYLVQNLFSKNKESRTISLNAQYMIVFKNPRDSNRTRPTTCVYARPYCRTMHTSGSTYRSCLRRCESTINGSCVLIIRRIMSGRMKKQAVCLQMLIKTKNAKLRKAILEHADSELIRALCECAHNILRGNVKMTPREKTRLRKYQTKLRLIARKNVSVKQKRRHLQQTGGFLPALLAPLAASVVIPLLRQLFA